MFIHFHHAEASIYGADIEDISRMLKIPQQLFNSYQLKSGAMVYTYAIPQSGAKESVAIRIPENSTAAGMIKLHGSFFDYYTEFPMNELRDYVSDQSGNIYHVDISYVDNDNVLIFEEYARMSLAENYKSYLTGSTTVSRKSKDSADRMDSNTRGGIPDVHANHSLIHYGNVSSNYVKFYQKPNKPCKFELTLRDKLYIKLLLEKYNPETITEFESMAKAALVKAINFITPASKRAKRPVQVASYKAFLGSEIKPICWTDHTPDRDLVSESFDSGLTRAIAQIQNLCRKHGILLELQKDILNLEETAKRIFDSQNLNEIDFADFI